ncbi:MAG: DUF1684 domain-containing protein [Acidobacteria bacterium]|nr:DUF1684 domain-containing protein [Acidobacteriota bacterium]MSO83912.1 DUF1684 domain-containing protein [Acidobacteriota bacterium]
MVPRYSQVFIILTLAALCGCSSGPSAPDEQSYLQKLAAARTEKDNLFKEAPDCNVTADARCSPVPPPKRATLLPLRYYAADSAYNVPAILKLADDRPVFEMPTSTGKPRRMQLVGTLEFSMQGQPQSLGAFVEDGTEQILNLFVPFADMTTGKETYPAGRYLDLHPTATGYYEIDFNRAYNPYCAYNASYECPFPPPDNRLKLPIRAGEKEPGA